MVYDRGSQQMSVLAIGAHPDDVELGCGATLAAHAARGDSVTLLVMTPGEGGPQHRKSRVAEQEEAARVLNADLLWGGFRDGAVPTSVETVDAIEAAIDSVKPDIIYTHTLDDSHQDHRATAD